MVDEIVFDPWTPMSFKRALGNVKAGGISWVAKSWVPETDQRRLLAYCVLQSYLDNAARYWMEFTKADEVDEHREYGDAALLRNVILAALLGEDQEIITEGAEDYNEEDEEQDSDAKAAWELQEWVRKWADDERWRSKLMETERDAVGLADGVYALGWNEDKGRPRLRCYDPGFYFPILDDGNEDDYPKKVHIAWELTPDPDEMPPKLRVRRITWELVRGEPRSYPWNDKPTEWHCLMSDGTWVVNMKQGFKVNSFDESEAEWEMYGAQEAYKLDIGIDFIPVVHVPNTVALKDHFGRSSLATVLQILDDLANADTDLQAASATTGNPVLALGGAVMPNEKLTYSPGDVFQVGDGRLDALDTSKSLDALIKYVGFLLARISTNARTPDALLGRVSPADVPSGVAVAFTFGPLISMIAEMRLVRDEKYQLLWKFAWRMARAGGMAEVPEQWFTTRLQLGRYLPQDVAGVIKLVTELYGAKLISLETGIAMLIEAGLPIEDAQEEMKRIQARDFEGAIALLEATGDEEAMFEYLDREPPINPPVPVIQVPPPPPPAGGPAAEVPPPVPAPPPPTT